jgi:hypothetical protein
MLGKVSALGSDIAVVEVDEDGLHCHNIVRLGLTVRGHSALHDEESEAARGRLACLGRNVLREICIRAEKRSTGNLAGLSLFGELPDGDPTVAVTEQDL